MINTTDVQIDQAELERRLAEYTGTEAFERGIEALAEEYRALRLPVPRPMRCSAAARPRRRASAWKA